MPLTTAELQARKREVVQELRGISADAKAARRSFTASEQSRIDQLTREDDRLTDLIGSMPQPRRTSADAGSPLGRGLPPAAGRGGAGSTSGFRDPHEFLLAVMDHGRGRTDSRLHSLAVGSDEHGIFSDSYGGVTVPTGFLPDLLKIQAEMDPAAAYTRKVPMDSQSVTIPARTDKNHTTSVSGGLRVFRGSEAASVSSSRMEMESLRLEVTGLYGLAYASEQLLKFSRLAFTSLLADGFATEFGAKLAQEKLYGSGVGQYEGVINSPALVTVTKESGQAADTLIYENIIKMRSRCWGYSNAIWLANHDTLPQLMQLNASIGSGGVFLWQPSAREDHPDMLLGRPLYFTEYARGLGDVGDLLLGNWSEYLEGTVGETTGDESIHVRFVEHERTFRFVKYCAGKCWWRSPLTPVNSTATMSPFVALQAR